MPRFFSAVFPDHDFGFLKRGEYLRKVRWKAFTILITVNYNVGIQKVTIETAINIKKRDDEHLYFFIFQNVILALLRKASCPEIQPFLKF